MANNNNNKKNDLNEQAFLWDFYELFQNEAEFKKPPSDTPQEEQSNSSNVQANSNTQLVKMPYQNFIQLTDFEPHLTLNKITAQGASALDDIQTHQMSALTPFIALSKIVKDGGQKITIPFPFGDFTTESSITDSVLDRGIDAGIKTITWSDVGTNPANVGMAFQGQLKLFFQSFESIFKVRNDGPYQISFSDLLDKTEALKTFSDNNPADVNLEDSYEIKLEVGWSPPTDPGNVLGGNNLDGRLKVNRRSYILENLNQQLSINQQDGSVELTIDFVAALEGRSMGTVADILYVDESNNLATSTRGSTAEKKKQLAEKRKELQSKQKDLRTLNNAGKSKNLTARDALKKDIERVKSQIKTLRGEISSLSYKRVINSLRSDNILINDSIVTPSTVAKNLQNNGKIRYFDIDKEIQTQYRDLLDSAIEDIAELKDTISDNASKGKEFLQREQKRLTNEAKENRSTSLSSIASLLSPLINNSSKANEDSGESRKIELIPEKGKPPESYALEDGKRRVYYFFLGDLIESIMKIIYNNPATNKAADKTTGGNNPKSSEFIKSFKVMMGSLNYENPLTGRKIKVDIADIPVSFTYFNGWFWSSVVKQQLSQYPFKAFVRDLCSKLVNNLFSPERHGLLTPRKPLQTRTQSIWVDENSDLSKFWNTNIKNLKYRFGVESFFRRSMQDTSPIIVPTEFFYIYVVGGDTDQLADIGQSPSRRAFNASRNIPHYTIGNQTGILKDVSFSRTKIPYKFEASLSEEASSIRKNLLFQDKYDANVVLFGNPSLKPGMIVYLDTKTLGLGSAAAGAKNVVADYGYNLGIGGYYRIVRVHNTISDAEFTTTLETVSEIDFRDIKFILDKNNVEQ